MIYAGPKYLLMLLVCEEACSIQQLQVTHCTTDLNPTAETLKPDHAAGDAMHDPTSDCMPHCD